MPAGCGWCWASSGWRRRSGWWCDAGRPGRTAADAATAAEDRGGRGDRGAGGVGRGGGAAADVAWAVVDRPAGAVVPGRGVGGLRTRGIPRGAGAVGRGSAVDPARGGAAAPGGG